MTRVIVRAEHGIFRLYTNTIGTGTTLPAGPRLRKGCIAGNAFPIRSFTFKTEAEALAAAADLEAYIEKDRATRSKRTRSR